MINSGNIVVAIITKMNALLQEYGAKDIYKVQEGLRELCTDIAREVLRSQPRNIYCFIADYLEMLLITRENAKVAVKIVNNVLMGSQAIVSILYRSGLSLEQIARVTPRIQKAFRDYLDAIDVKLDRMCHDLSCDEKSKESLENILQATGVSLKQAKKIAMIIQSTFHDHYERMLLNESSDMIQPRQAAAKTLEILSKAGTTQAEASKAAILIQATYRGYYTRKNLKMKLIKEKTKDEIDTTKSREDSQVTVWLNRMYEDSGLSQARANEAASTIQKAYRRYRMKSGNYNTTGVKLTKSVTVEPILEDVYNKVSDKVISHENISMKLDAAKTSYKNTFNSRLKYNSSLKEYNEIEFKRLEEMPDESFLKPIDYLNNMIKDRKEAQKIEEESERDEETDVYVRDKRSQDEPINMVTTSKQEKKQDNKQKEQDKQEVSLETGIVGDTTA